MGGIASDLPENPGDDGIMTFCGALHSVLQSELRKGNLLQQCLRFLKPQLGRPPPLLADGPRLLSAEETHEK